MLGTMTRRRVVLLLLAALIATGIAYEHTLANSLDAGCGAICAAQCMTEGGCRYFRASGCNCRFQCKNGTQGVRICVLTQ